METYVLSLDQGTTSSRAILFDRKARVVSLAQREIRQIYPQPGWVEHDPLEIWESQLAVAREAIASAGVKGSQIVDTWEEVKAILLPWLDRQEYEAQKQLKDVAMVRTAIKRR